MPHISHRCGMLLALSPRAMPAAGVAAVSALPVIRLREDQIRAIEVIVLRLEVAGARCAFFVGNKAQRLIFGLWHSDSQNSVGVAAALSTGTCGRAAGTMFPRRAAITARLFGIGGISLAFASLSPPSSASEPLR